MASGRLRFLLQGQSWEWQMESLPAEGISFRSKNPPINITIRRKQDEEKPVICKLRLDLPATDEQIALVAGLRDDRYVGYGNAALTLPHITKPGDVAIDVDGKLTKGQRFWFEWLPPDLQELVNEARDLLEGQFSRFMGMLRWTQDYQCVDPFEVWHPTLYWASPSERTYHFTPSPGKAFALGSMRGLSWRDEDRTIFRRVWRSKIGREPLCHELRIEAERLEDVSPRSALLIACSALEVGLKQHIAVVLPRSEWLVFNAPSPPIDKILRYFVPELHASRSHIAWKKLSPIFTTCKQMVEARNGLAHRGDDPNSEDLQCYLSAVRKALFLLDYLRGEDWVERHIEEPVRSALGLGALSRPLRLNFTIADGPDI